MKILINHEFTVNDDNLSIDKEEFKKVLKDLSIFFSDIENIIILPQKITLDDQTCLSFLKTGVFDFEHFKAVTNSYCTLCLELIK